MSSQGMSLNSVSDGSCMSVSWFVGVLVFCESSLGVPDCFEPVGVGVVGLFGIINCLISSGVFGVVCMGMSGQVAAKQRGCHDSPWLLVLRTRHSRPMKSWLQTVHVALVCGTRSGCMVV